MSNKPTLQEKIENNIWDRLFEVLPTIEAAKNGIWSWLNNSKCKYIDLRIDMRTGHCILSDSAGNRINPEDFSHQFVHSGGLRWKWPEPTSRVDEYLIKCREASEEAGAVNELPTGDWNTRYIEALARRGLGLMIMPNVLVKHPHLYRDGIPSTAPRPTRDNEQAWPKNTVVVWLV